MFKNFKENRNNNYKYNKQHEEKKKIEISIEQNKKYINPYNFITLPKKCERESYTERKGNLTGYIECELIAKTPIIIPDTKNVKTEVLHNQKEFKKYNFFNYEEKSEDGEFVLPVIPGSEIRGMLRNDYEVFTNSCMSTLNNDIKLISRTKEIKLPGIIEKDANGNWKLFSATRYSLHTCRKGKGSPRDARDQNEAIYFVDNKNTITINNKKYKTGDKVKFSDKGINVVSIGNGKLEGILFIGEIGGKKDFNIKAGKNNIHDSIFVKGEEVTANGINESVDDLKSIYDMYNDSSFNQKIRGSSKIWYDGYDLENKNILPVWYSEPNSEGKCYLSLAAIGKEAYHRTLQELVGEFMPCIDKMNICKACDMFGFVSDGDAIASKVRISDAIYEGNNNPYDEKRIIKELASPHIANATFYALYAPNNQFNNLPQYFDFNYDFRSSKDGQTEIKSQDITIRGRKMYWHHDDIQNSKTTEKTERNCEVTPVKKSTTFKFKVFFDNIKEQNLQELIAVINLQYKEKDLCHKIGKAKPLGYGSCKINVNNVYIKNITLENNKIKYEMKKYEQTKIKLNDVFDMTTVPMIEASRIYDFTYIKKNYPNTLVQYPVGVKGNKEASMYWFMINKSTNLKNPYVLMVLPRIIDGKDENGQNEFTGKIKVQNKELGEIKGLELPRFKMTEKT